MYLFKINNKYTSTTSDVDLVSRSSRPKVFCKKVFLKIHTCVEDSFLTDVAALRSATLLKEILQHTCFPMNYWKFLKTLFFIEQLRWVCSFCYLRTQSAQKSTFLTFSNEKNYQKKLAQEATEQP